MDELFGIDQGSSRKWQPCICLPQQNHFLSTLSLIYFFSDMDWASRIKERVKEEETLDARTLL